MGRGRRRAHHAGRRGDPTLDAGTLGRRRLLACRRVWARVRARQAHPGADRRPVRLAQGRARGPAAAGAAPCVGGGSPQGGAHEPAGPRPPARPEAEAANRAKDDFLAVLSHELRTPLNATFGWVRMLRSGRLDGAAAEHGLEVIERNVTQQSRLISDLLDASRIVFGRLELSLQAVDFPALVAS